MNIACDLFATTVKTPLNRFVVRAVCSFARSQGISPVRAKKEKPWKRGWMLSPWKIYL